MNGVIQLGKNKEKKTSFLYRLRADFVKHKYVYMIAFPVLIYYIVFKYIPMYGIVMAFQDFSIGKGFFDSPWVGLKHFESFFGSMYFWDILRNTFLISLYDLIWSFPAPIIFAILLNEIKSVKFKKLTQTITYMPHFISAVVICGMIKDFTSSNGIVTQLLVWLGMDQQNLLMVPDYFRTIYVASGIWQGIGWSSIIYLAALTSIDNQLYEAAALDGAGKLKQIIHVTLPGITPTIVILLVMRLGNMLNVGFEKILLLYNPMTYEKADVISTFVYRKGLIEANYSYGAAVGLFNTAINLILLILANKISKRLTETSLW